MRLVSIVSAGSIALSSVSARACTVCDSPTGHQLRAGLFDGHFLRTVATVGAPVPVFVAAVLLLHRLMPTFDEAERPRHPATLGDEISAPECAA